jgi:hypothetical protein
MLTAAVLLAASAGAGLGEEKSATLKSACCDFALNPRTGDLAGIDPNANTITLYPKAYLEGKSAEVIGPVKVGKTPVSVLFKLCRDKACFVVACQGEGNIQVLDAKDLKLVKNIALGSSESSSLACALDPGDPYVYYTFARGHGSSAGRINLATMADEGKLTFPGSFSSVMDLAVSADGNYLYPRGPWSPPGLQAVRREKDPDTGQTSWHSVSYEHDDTGLCVPDPYGIYTFGKQSLYSPDLTQKLQNLPFWVICFFPDRPVIIGIQGEAYRREGWSLVAASYNTFKVFGLRPLTRKTGGGEEEDEGLKMPPVPNQNSDFKRFGFRTRYLPDGASSRLIIAHGRDVTLLPLADLKVEDEPMLAASVTPPANLFVGAAASIEVKPLDKRCVVTLADGPKGMKLTGNVLGWTPDASQVGPAKAVLLLQHEKLERRQTVELNVVQSSIRLAFAPDRFEISPNGKLGVAWTLGGSRQRWGRDAEQPKQNSRVALVDLEKRKVLADRKLLYDVSCAAVDDHFVYVSPAQSDGINLLGPKDLEKTNFTLTDSRVSSLTAVGSRLLLATTEKSVMTYSVPDFKPVDSILTRKPETEDAFGMRAWRGDDDGALERFGDGWYACGCLFGPDLGAAQMMVGASGLPTLRERDREASPRKPLLWNRLVNRGELLSASQQRIGQLDRGYTRMLADYPAAANLKADHTERRIEGPTARVKVYLTLVDLLSAAAVAKLPLLDEPMDEGAFPVFIETDERGDGPMRTHGRQVFALVKDRIFVQTLDDETLKKFSCPFELVPFREVVSAGVKRPTTIPVATRGGQTPFEFELKTQRDGVSIDTKTGAVTVDGAKTLDAAVRLIMQSVGQESEEEDPYSKMGRRQGDPKKHLADFAKAAKTRFKQLAGRDPAGIPVLLPVGVVARDKNQQTASLDFEVALEVPDDAVQQFIGRQAEAEKQRLDEEKKQQAEYERQMREEEKRRREAETKRAETKRADTKRADTGGAADDRVGKLEAQVADMEAKVKALEAKIDLLVKLLQSQKTPDPGERK